MNQTMKDRIEAAVEDAIHDGLDSALPKHFPEAKSGDESPEMAFALHDAIEIYIAAWVSNNVLSDKYTLDDELIDLEEFIELNQLDKEQEEQCREMKRGEEKIFGGGAAAVFVLKRIS